MSCLGRFGRHLSVRKFRTFTISGVFHNMDLRPVDKKWQLLIYFHISLLQIVGIKGNCLIENMFRPMMSEFTKSLVP